jgi:hypothetical protein
LTVRGLVDARWFHWVAGLSDLNWVILHQGGSLRFVVGLGITVIADNTARAATLRAAPSFKI